MTKKQKYTVLKDGNVTTYFLNGVKRFECYKDSDGYERWREYDKQGNEIYCKDSSGYAWWREYGKQGNRIHYKDSNGYEWWSDDHPDNPKNKTTEVTLEEIKPFTFKHA